VENKKVVYTIYAISELNFRIEEKEYNYEEKIKH